MKLIGAQKCGHSHNRQTTTDDAEKMFGIAKVARVLGAHFFLQWFCIHKNVWRFRIQVPNDVGRRIQVPNDVGWREQKSSGAYRPHVDAHL